MKIRTSILALFTASTIIAAITVSGCTINNYYNQDTRTRFTESTSPPDQKGTTPPRPSNKHVWIDGFWRWDSSTENWTWIKGSWVIPPDKDAVWVSPDYGKSGTDSTFKPGHWKQKPKNKANTGSKPATSKPIKNKTTPKEINKPKKEHSTSPILPPATVEQSTRKQPASIKQPVIKKESDKKTDNKKQQENKKQSSPANKFYPKNPPDKLH